MRKVSIIIAVAFMLCATSRAVDFDPFAQTPQEYAARAQWFRDAKFGVFIHWNPSSLVGQEISWCRDKVGREKYDALYKEFKGERFNADEWVRLFHEAGIRYAVLVPKHHDGFCMFDTKTSDYSVMRSPFGRDYIKEMSDACARSDVRFCLYYSILDWWNPAYSGAAGADLTRYKNEVFKPHMQELLTKYGPVGCIWFDGHWEASWTHADGREMYGFIRRLQPATLLGNRIDQKASADGPNCKWTGSFFNGAPDPVGDYQAREVDLGTYYTDKAWDCCFSLCGVNSRWSWFPPMNPRPLPEVLGWLIQCIGRDGNLLLGVGPRPDGTISPDNAAALLDIGDWLKLNGEAVYGTRGGPYLPGDWGVSTRKDNKVFLFVTRWAGESLVLPALPAKVKAARLITRGTVAADQEGADLTIRVPESFQRPVATIVELTMDRETLPLAVVEVPDRDPQGRRLLSKDKPATVSGVWPGREDADLKVVHINDGNFDTLWAGPEASRDGWVQIDLGEEREVEAVVVDDHSYNRTRKFEVQAQVGGEWTALATGTTIGSRKHLDFAPVKSRLFRLAIQEATDTPVVNEFQIFGAGNSSPE
jgi:alpha-L-fucosidase